MNRANDSTHAGAPAGSLQPARYRVLEVLGEGGMGVVYRAYDPLRDRIIALKRMRVQGEREALGDESSFASMYSTRQHVRSLFQREYHTLAQLAHPNIIEVYDYGVDAAGPYYTMELLAGHDLRELAPMPWSRACALLRDVAAALTLLHSRRVLHRDISPRNVRCVAERRAKLIDFGALTPMGVEQVVAGTPPFVPPEALARQALDARADVFSLGALAYWLLTGRHAFPARSLREVRDAWRSPPALPSLHAPDVPEALDALVMRMLSLDRRGRPATAIELVERLSALAGLEHEAAGATVISAYLTTPSLVARSPALAGVRKRIVRALTGRGASLLVSGPAGVGRSRFLDECMFEAKLAGALVLRIGRADAASGAYGGARALFDQLAVLATERDRGSLPPPAVAALQGHEPAGVAARSEAQAALLASLLRVATNRLVMIAADDAHALDEPTLSLLAALATQVATRRLVLVSTCDPAAPASAAWALSVLRDASHGLPLLSFVEAETEELLRSLFGDVANLKLLASRIHALSSGLPLLCMDLAQHLVDRGVVQCRAGGFVLPASLPAHVLPASLHEALRARVSVLSEDARVLGGGLALAGQEALAHAECIELREDRDPARLYAAISELLAAQLIHLEAECVRLAHGYGPAFAACLRPEQVLALHERLGALFARDPRRCVRAAEHFLLAHRDADAVDALLGYVRDAQAQRHWFSDYLRVLTAGIAASTRLQRPAGETFALRHARARAVATYLEPGDREPLLALAHELCELAGLGFYQQLNGELDAELRVRRAFELASARYDALPVHERILSPREAIGAFVLYQGLLASYAGNTLDVELLHRLPSLAPYSALVPAVAFMDKIVRATRHMRAERLEAGHGLLLECVAELEQPGALGLEDARRLATRARIYQSIGLDEASLGLPDALLHAEIVAAEPDQRINAWHVRHIVHLYRPDAEQAQECRRQIELLQLQGGPRQYAEGGSLEAELLAYARSDDLLNLRRIRPGIADMACRHSGYLPWLAIVDGELERICGRPERAAELHATAMSDAEPGKHLAWPHAAAFRLEALVLLGRYREVRELGRQWRALAEQHQLDSALLIAQPLALAEAALGNGPLAREIADEFIARTTQHKMTGLYLGLGYETRARVAIALGDGEGFAAAFASCQEQYGAGKYPPLTSRLEKLVTAARRARLDGLGSDESAFASTLSVGRVLEVLASSSSPEDRARRALTLVLEATGAVAGFLYGVRAAELDALASQVPDQSAVSDVEAMLRQCLAAHADQDHTVLLLGEHDRAAIGSVSVVSDAFGLRYYPFVLASAADGGRKPMIAALLALAFPDGRCGALAPEIAAAVGAELLAHRDVTGLTVLR